MKISSKISMFIWLSTFVINSLFATEAPKHIDKAQITAYISTYLNQELNDIKLSNTLATEIVAGTLDWKPRTIDISEGDYIVAYSFGNDIAANGNKLPGQMNKDLADTVVKIYNQTKKPVYAQWEIAKSIGNRIPKNDLHTIDPTIQPDGDVIYLSTSGVSNDFINSVGKNNLKGKKIIVVGFVDHIQRCVNSLLDENIDAYAPKGYGNAP